MDNKKVAIYWAACGVGGSTVGIAAMNLLPHREPFFVAVVLPSFLVAFGQWMIVLRSFSVSVWWIATPVARVFFVLPHVSWWYFYERMIQMHGRAAEQAAGRDRLVDLEFFTIEMILVAMAAFAWGATQFAFLRVAFEGQAAYILATILGSMAGYSYWFVKEWAGNPDFLAYLTPLFNLHSLPAAAQAIALAFLMRKMEPSALEEGPKTPLTLSIKRTLWVAWILVFLALFIWAAFQ